MPRQVTYKVGIENFEKYRKEVEGAVQEITVEVHELDAEPWPVDTPLRHVGHDIPRLDAPAKVTGAAKYTYDINTAGMTYCGFVTSPHAHAIIKKVDASKAESMKGVLGVKTFEGNRATYPGYIAAGVCAESPGILDDALQAIQVDYEVKPGPCTTEDAMKPGAETVDMRGESNVRGGRPMQRGKIDEAFGSADVKVAGEYRTAVQTHSCLEPHGSVVQVNPDGGATVWASTQATSGFARGAFLRGLGVQRNRVRVLTEHMGGGFGSKFGPGSWDAIAAEFAAKTKRPVKMLLSRRMEHLLGGNRPDSIQKLELAGTKDGSFLGIRGETWGTAGNGGRGAGATNTMVYNWPARAMRQNGVNTFSMWGRAFRAPRHPQGSFAMEAIIERYAHEIGMDPLAVRMKNDPHPIRQVQWRIGADRIDWKKNRRKVPGSDKGVVKRGLGCAAARWSQAGRHMSRGGPYTVDIAIDREGNVTVANCVQDIGTGIRTVMAILAAEELGTDPSLINVEVGDSRLKPGPGSGGSTTSPTIGPAVRTACVVAKDSLKALLALEWNVDESKIEWTDGDFVDPAGKRATFPQACSLIGDDGLRVSGQRQRNWTSPYRETAGCQFAQVSVDTETGVITVEKVVAVHDCGRVVDALTARNQVNGGVIQGISYALYEEKQLDRNLGDMVNPTFDTYRIMGMADCPEIDAVMTSVVSGFNNAGMMGLGEPATVPTAAAVANAVFNAIGVEVPELPMTPARVLTALEGKQG